MSLIDDIKTQAKKAGSNKGKFVYFKAGAKVRVRFLEDMDDGRKIAFHDSFASGINVPCQETFGRECKYCEDDDLRTRDQYAWCVWDYDAKEVKVIIAPVNQCSPIPSLVAMYETYGTLTDRDYVITKSGAQQTTTYSVVPMDKAKFRNDKAKPFSDSKFYDLLDKAFPSDDDDEDDGDKKKKKKTPPKSKGKAKPEPEDEDEDEDEGVDYEDMSAKELYSLCKTRGIKAEKQKPAKYYIKLLKSADEEDNDDDEEDEDDDWDE
jgi:hypothetical protein